MKFPSKQKHDILLSLGEIFTCSCKYSREDSCNRVYI